MTVEISTWDHWETAVAGQTLATSLSEADSAVWNPWETAVLSQIVAGSLVELKCGILDGPWPAIDILCWNRA